MNETDPTNSTKKAETEFPNGLNVHGGSGSGTSVMIVLIVLAVPAVVFAAFKISKFIDNKYREDDFDQDSFEMDIYPAAESKTQTAQWDEVSTRFSESSELDEMAMKHLNNKDSFSVDDFRSDEYENSVVRFSEFDRDSFTSSVNSNHPTFVRGRY